MKHLTREWIDKTEGDLHTAQREIRARKWPNPDSACFHAQQCVEKYFKARLQEAGVTVPRTHDLSRLLKLLLPIEPLWTGLLQSAVELSKYAVDTRYPGSSVARAEAQVAVKRCREIRKLVRQSLGIKP